MKPEADLASKGKELASDTSYAPSRIIDGTRDVKSALDERDSIQRLTASRTLPKRTLPTLSKKYTARTLMAKVGRNVGMRRTPTGATDAIFGTSTPLALRSGHRGSGKAPSKNLIRPTLQNAKV